MTENWRIKFTWHFYGQKSTGKAHSRKKLSTILKEKDAMTELSFLIELLLNHDLQKATKDLIAERIKTVEQNLSQLPMGGVIRPTFSGVSTQLSPPQVQSTLDAMARHEGMAMMGNRGVVHPQQLPPEMPPVPVEAIAQTPAAAQAMNSRNQAIAASIAGKVDKETGRPRKW